jgi:hypothetical protein
MSKEDYDNTINKHIETIKKDKLELQKRRKNAFKADKVETHWMNFKSTMLFMIFFLTFDVMILILQLNNSDAYDQNSVKDFLSGMIMDYDPFFGTNILSLIV